MLARSVLLMTALLRDHYGESSDHAVILPEVNETPPLQVGIASENCFEVILVRFSCIAQNVVSAHDSFFLQRSHAGTFPRIGCSKVVVAGFVHRRKARHLVTSVIACFSPRSMAPLT